MRRPGLETKVTYDGPDTGYQGPPTWMVEPIGGKRWRKYRDATVVSNTSEQHAVDMFRSRVIALDREEEARRQSVYPKYRHVDIYDY